MSISYIAKKKLFTIHTVHSTWQMKVGRYGHLLHVYYGKRTEDTDLSYLIREMDRGFCGYPYEARDDRGYSLDTLPQEYPCFGAGDYRTACLHVIHADGSQAAELRYVSDLRGEIQPSRPSVGSCLRYGGTDAGDLPAG